MTSASAFPGPSAGSALVDALVDVDLSTCHKPTSPSTCSRNTVSRPTSVDDSIDPPTHTTALNGYDADASPPRLTGVKRPVSGQSIREFRPPREHSPGSDALVPGPVVTVEPGLTDRAGTYALLAPRQFGRGRLGVRRFTSWFLDAQRSVIDRQGARATTRPSFTGVNRARESNADVRAAGPAMLRSESAHGTHRIPTDPRRCPAPRGPAIRTSQRTRFEEWGVALRRRRRHRDRFVQAGLRLAGPARAARVTPTRRRGPSRGARRGARPRSARGARA